MIDVDCGVSLLYSVDVLLCCVKCNKHNMERYPLAVGASRDAIILVRFVVIRGIGTGQTYCFSWIGKQMVRERFTTLAFQVTNTLDLSSQFHLTDVTPTLSHDAYFISTHTRVTAKNVNSHTNKSCRIFITF